MMSLTKVTVTRRAIFKKWEESTEVESTDDAFNENEIPKDY